MAQDRYEVTTLDVCVYGMERLRNRNEFILTARIDAETDSGDLLEEWLRDIQACDRPDGFDYDAVREAVTNYYESTVRPLFRRRSNPFNLESGRTDIGLDEFDSDTSCTAFLFIRDNQSDA
jgi:hypothetical protein